MLGPGNISDEINRVFSSYSSPTSRFSTQQNTSSILLYPSTYILRSLVPTYASTTVGGIAHDRWTATLMPTGLLALTRPPPDLQSRESIIDKSNADLIAIQALRMVVQCATRQAYGLPVTLPESQVVKLVGYASPIYCFRWIKPQNINVLIEVLEYIDSFDADLVDSVRVVPQAVDMAVVLNRDRRRASWCLHPLPYVEVYRHLHVGLARNRS